MTTTYKKYHFSLFLYLKITLYLYQFFDISATFWVQSKIHKMKRFLNKIRFLTTGICIHSFPFKDVLNKPTDKIFCKDCKKSLSQIVVNDFKTT